MKRKILIIALLVLTSYSLSNAQGAFRKGNFGMNLGMGLGWGYHRPGNHNFSFIPSGNFSFQYGAIGIEDVGTISFGCIFDYRRTWYEYNNYALYAPYPYRTFRDTWGNFTFAFRPAFHLGFINSTKLDAYAGFDFGIRRRAYFNERTGVTDHSVQFAPDFFIGGRYFFTKNFGVFTELAFNIAYFKFGFAFKF